MYTISLVANKLGKNMLAFAEDFSYSQDDKNVLLSNNNDNYLIPKSNKKWETFSLLFETRHFIKKTIRNDKLSIVRTVTCEKTLYAYISWSKRN